MICTTVRQNEECIFMTKAGCSYKEGSCLPVIDKCEGCAKISEYPAGRFCTTSPDPAGKWKLGNCNMGTHIVVETADKGTGKKVNPLKASKRGGK